MIFIHRRTLRKGRAIAAIVQLLGFSFFLGLATYFVFFQDKPSATRFGKALFAILAFTLLVLIWWFICLFTGKGGWSIQISENELI